MKKIEQLLFRNEGELEHRIKQLKDSIPTLPGTEYLKMIHKRFEAQPWPFISYIAHYAPDRLKAELDCYRDYDGAENYHAVIEGLKESYVIGLLLERMTLEKNIIDITIK